MRCLCAMLEPLVFAHIFRPFSDSVERKRTNLQSQTCFHQYEFLPI